MIFDRDADGVRALALSSDGHTLAVVDDAGWLRIWSLATAGATVLGEGATGLSLPHALAITPDAQRVVVVGEGGGALFSKEAEPQGSLPAFGQALHALAFLPKGQRLLVASDDGLLRLLDFPGYQVLAQTPIGERNAGIAVSGDGRRCVVSASWQGGSELLVLRLDGDRILPRSEPRLRAPIDALSAAALSVDGRSALLPGRELWLVDVDAGTVRTAFDYHGQIVTPQPGSVLLEQFWTGAVRLPNGNFAAASPTTGRILVVDPAVGTLAQTWEGHEGGVLALAAGPGVLISAGVDRTLRSWPIEA